MDSKLQDDLRWIAPVPGRLSKLQNKKFTPWKEKDPHPGTDNSYKSYQKIGQMFFGKTEVQSIGSLERFNRVLPGVNSI